jgi:hypothetical protein
MLKAFRQRDCILRRRLDGFDRIRESLTQHAHGTEFAIPCGGELGTAKPSKHVFPEPLSPPVYDRESIEEVLFRRKMPLR